MSSSVGDKGREVQTSTLWGGDLSSGAKKSALTANGSKHSRLGLITRTETELAGADRPFWDHSVCDAPSKHRDRTKPFREKVPQALQKVGARVRGA
jgi:hypothetical protein